MTSMDDAVVRTSVSGTELALTVTAIAVAARGVRHVRLTDSSGRTLPSFTPGSHIVLRCGTCENGRVRRNSYSLVGPEFEPDHYAISVRLDENGRGGSRWIHELAVGDIVGTGMPQSAFAPVLTARHHVLVAGGIGVTPILSHARAAARWGRSFEVHYTHRDRDDAHLADLRELCGNRLRVYRSRAEFLVAMESTLLDRPLGTHLYMCGPPGLIDDLSDRAIGAGWPASRIHYERFGVGDLDPGEPFIAHLRRTGIDVSVDAGVSLLDALEAAGVAVPSLCRRGVCGECRLPVTGGVDHRDLYLTTEEKDAGDAVMPCVSRASDNRLELDL